MRERGMSWLTSTGTGMSRDMGMSRGTDTGMSTDTDTDMGTVGAGVGPGGR